MDSNTSELYRFLESGPYDEAGLNQVKRLLGAERRALRAKNDFTALEQLIPMLQHWAQAAGGGWLSASALGEAAEIAELELRNSARAEELRTQAITTGRTASGTPIAMQAPEPTQDVHTIDLEVAATLSALPPPDNSAISAEIAHAEHVLAADSSPDRVRELAELYARRDGPKDRENAAQLYCTLAEMLGNPAGVPMLERAIALIPDHAEAKALLMRYAVKPRRVSSPKITLLGASPLAVPQAPPPAAAGLSAPKPASSGAKTPGNPPPPAAGGNRNTLPLQPLAAGSLTPQPLPAVAANAPPHAAEPIAPHPPLAAAGRARPPSSSELAAQRTLAMPGNAPRRKPTPPPSLLGHATDAVPAPAASSSLPAPLTAAGAALANAAARISSHPPAARASSRPPGRRSSTSPGYASAVTASALAEEPASSAPWDAADRAIPVQTVASESAPPLSEEAAVAPPLAAADGAVTPADVPERQPANDTRDAAAAADQAYEGPEVLQLHGIPQVRTNRPSVPEISSLSSLESEERESKRIPKKTKRAVLASGMAFGAVAALGIYLNMPSKESPVSPPPSAASAPVAQAPIAPQLQEPPEPVVANLESEVAATAPEPDQPTEPTPTEPSQPSEPSQPTEPQPSAAREASGTPAPLAPPAPSHLPTLKLEAAKLKGGKLNETQLAQALSKAEPKLLGCYAQAIEQKPRLKGRVLYSFNIQPTGRASNIKRAGGTLKDDAMFQCSSKVLESVRFPKPRKTTQVKLPIQYKRT